MRGAWKKYLVPGSVPAFLVMITYVSTLLPTMKPTMRPLDETANCAAANSTEDAIIYAAARRRRAAFRVLLCLTVPMAPGTLHRRAVGNALLEGLLDGAPAMWQRLFRMTKASFEALLDWLKQDTIFKGSHRASEQEKLLIFLCIVCQGMPHNIMAYIFSRSDETINRLV